MRSNAELGCYLLAGQPESPRELLEEAREAETLGLGTAFISERYQSKEAATLCGAAGAVTDRIRIATAATNHLPCNRRGCPMKMRESQIRGIVATAPSRADLWPSSARDAQNGGRTL